MKGICTLLLAATLAIGAGAAEKKPLRVLMIGNSFSLSVMRELPNIVDAQDVYALDITSMYIGGAPDPSSPSRIPEYGVPANSRRCTCW